MTSAAPSYKRPRYPVEIIDHGVWLYFRFTLSFREVEEMMLGRDSVRRSWTIAAGRQISLRQRGAQSDRCTRTVKPSADEVPLGWGVPEEGVS